MTLSSQLINLGLKSEEVSHLLQEIDDHQKNHSPEETWQHLIKTKHINRFPFAVYALLYETIYPNWAKVPSPIWFPAEDALKNTHIGQWMKKYNLRTYKDLHTWSHQHYPIFWVAVMNSLKIQFDVPYKNLVDLTDGLEYPHWFPNAKLNIVNSCFNVSAEKIAVIEQTSLGLLQTLTYGDLTKLINRIAHSLCEHLKEDAKVALILPMTSMAIAAYLAAIKAGFTVVSISPSFASEEIAKRLKQIKIDAVITQDYIFDKTKYLPLYEKLIDANAPFSIVIPCKNKEMINLRKQDIHWDIFLSNNDKFNAISCNPEAYINILYSSGTTGEAKLIPWNHVTPIKSASDAYFHLDLRPDEIFCFPTNLGWMMGPWLVFSCFINGATLALYNSNDYGRAYGEFIAKTKVNILGVIPTQISKWRSSGCMENLDWSNVRLFMSTAECSNIEDTMYLMSLANYKPVIDYCGGTEIGGAYLTSTLVQPNAPAAFTSPALGLDFVILDEKHHLAEKGEVAIIPPSIGLSTIVLNKDHHQLYYKKMPKLHGKKLLRRHGDQIERYNNGFYRVHGRIGDTMNLSGIKVSAVEIESVLNRIQELQETAAIVYHPPTGGPEHLIIYGVLKTNIQTSREKLLANMQQMIKIHLNPLFKIEDIVIVDMLPRTVSNKINRKKLREDYAKKYLSVQIKSPAIKSETNKKKICFALQGGGSFGAYTWGMLDKFLEADCFEIDAISATSAGSVNAVLLTYGFCLGGAQGARNALNNFWWALSQYGAFFSPVRQIPFFPIELDAAAQLSFTFYDLFTRTFSPYYSNPVNFDLLRLILHEQIDFEKLNKLSKIKLFISTTNVKSGMLKVFGNQEINIEVILASACLPNQSQAIEINGEYYWDGGYLGNPAIYPLIYHSNVSDLVILHNNPIFRDNIPTTSAEIANRINEISFNSSLLREIRAIAFVTKLIDKGWIKEQYLDNIKRKYIHIIRSDEIMNKFSLINKYNLHWDFLSHLRDLGRENASKWLKENFDHLGKKPTTEFQEFLGEDTQAQR